MVYTWTALASELCTACMLVSGFSLCHEPATYWRCFDILVLCLEGTA